MAGHASPELLAFQRPGAGVDARRGVRKGFVSAGATAALWAAWLAAIGPASVHGAPNFSLMPGVKISYQPSPSPLELLLDTDIYVCDNDIVVLPDGSYVASHAYFGGGSTSTSAAITKVFRSTDKGSTWTQVAQFQPLWRASLCAHGGALYIMGPEYDGASYNTIRRSADGGITWTTPTDASSGRFQAIGLTGTLGTPNNPLLFGNRLYYGGGGRSTFFTTNTTDPLAVGDWKQSNGIETFSSWQVGVAGTLGSAYIGEGQIVASPGQGVAVLAKVKGYPYAAVIRCDATVGNIVRFGPHNDFAALPGAEKKFGAMHDPASGKFYVLSNPVLPAHANDPNWGSKPDMIRNTAAILSSRDLRRWNVEKIFLYSPNIDYEGWQYLQFDFDGDDIVVASRTAFDVGDTYRPPRGHDSNLLTFHRIANFRTVGRNHYLVADTGNNRVLRHERTGHADAPLGKFTLGQTFDGAALSAPQELAQDTNGDVYVREGGGRIVRFDAAGNFIATVAASPVPFDGSQISITQPPDGRCSWINSGSGNWADLLNWYYWGRPDETTEFATFGSAATGDATITVDPDPLLWNFETDGDEEGWTTSNVTGAAVSGGVFAGTSSTADPMLNRVALAFPGSDSPEVRIRMRASGPSGTVDFFWGTTVANSFQAARKITVPYTGGGAFQELVIPVAGNPAWDGQMITRIRVDPSQDSGATFEIDYIKIPRDSFCVAGLLFQNNTAYTLTGAGSLRVQPAAGEGLVDVRSGSHAIGLTLALGTNTAMNAEAGTSLSITGAIVGKGNLAKCGAGTLLLRGSNTFSGACTVSNGTLGLSGALDGIVTVAGGVLEGSGCANRDVTISGGTHAPGDSIGVMRLRGNYALGFGGTLRVEIAGTGSDGLRLEGSAGTVTLAGTLDIVAAPAIPDESSFTVIENMGPAAVAGTFEGLPEGAEFYEDAQWWRISYAGGTGNDVVLTRIVPTPWQQWQASHFGPGTNDPTLAGERADHDDDGIPNLLEYALDTDPLLGGPRSLPVGSVVGGRLALTFARTVANTDITMIVQGANVLTGPWTDLALSMNGASFSPTGGGIVTETGSGPTRLVEALDAYLISDPAHPSRFLRLRVTR